MGKATEDLRKEHGSILHVLSIMDKMRAATTFDDAAIFQHYGEVVYFLKIFADKCHHGKEEGYLFPELAAKGVPNENGPIGVMLQEHELGRNYIAAMSQALESADRKAFESAGVGYGDLLRKHIDKENNVLFVMADRFIGAHEQNELFEKFEQHEESVIGHGVHEQLHAMIHKWTEDFDAH